MAQPVMARNPLTHRSGPYKKKGDGSSDSVAGEISLGWQGDAQAD
jgi:hypothetical protein